VAAGFALAVATVAGVAGRLVFGWIADHRGNADVLPAIGVLAGACALVLAFAPATWPGIAILAVAALFGATAIGWNGVYLAELARRSPPGTAGGVTGASGVVTFGGVMIGPTIFGLLSALPGGTRVGFAMLAVLIGGAAIAYVLWDHRKRAVKRNRA
jgi:MFS family permease